MGLWDFILGSSSPNSGGESITADIGKLNWRPAQDEDILVAHEKCQILKEGGSSLASTQYFTCCITNKGMALIPEGDYRVGKQMLSLGLSAFGIDGFRKRITLKYIYDKYIDGPIYIQRESIKSAEIDTYFIMNGKFKRDFARIVIDGETLYLGVQDIGYAMDVVTSIYQPELFTK